MPVYLVKYEEGSCTSGITEDEVTIGASDPIDAIMAAYLIGGDEDPETLKALAAELAESKIEPEEGEKDAFYFYYDSVCYTVKLKLLEYAVISEESYGMGEIEHQTDRVFAVNPVEAVLAFLRAREYGEDDENDDDDDEDRYTYILEELQESCSELGNGIYNLYADETTYFVIFCR